MRLKKESVLYHSAALAGSAILLQGMGFVYRIIISRLAGAEGMGIFQLIMPVYAVLSALCLSGLTMAVSAKTAECRGRGDGESSAALLGMTFRIFAGALSLCAVPVFLCSGWIARALIGEEEVRPALLLMLPCLALTGIENILKNYFLGKARLVPPIFSELAEQLIRIVAVTLLLLLSHPKNAAEAGCLIILGMVCSEVFSAIFLICCCRREQKRNASLPSCRPVLPRGLPLAGNILSVAVPVSLSGALNQLIGSANQLFLPRGLEQSGMTAGEAVSAVGVFSGMTLPLLMLPGIFIFPLNAVLLPRISADTAASNRSDIRRKTGKAIHVTSLLGMPSIAFLCLTGESISRMMYGSADPAEGLLPLSLGALMSFYNAVTCAILNGLGYAKRVSAICVAEGLIQLLCTLFGTPRWGISAYVAGFVVSSAFGGVITTVWAIQKSGVHLRGWNWFFLPGLGSAVGILLSRPAYHLLLTRMENDLLPVVAGGAIMLMGYGTVLRLAGMRPIHYLKGILEEKEMPVIGATL